MPLWAVNQINIHWLGGRDSKPPDTYNIENTPIKSYTKKHLGRS